MKMRMILSCGAIVGIAATLWAADATAPAAGPATKPGEKKTTESGLVIEYKQGAEGAKNGDVVWVLYTGKLQNGTEFDSTARRGNEPLEFQLGRGMVIKGWDEGILGMQVGEKRTLTIPPKLAYKEQGAGDVIPPNATLTFDVELVGLKRSQQAPAGSR